MTDVERKESRRKARAKWRAAHVDYIREYNRLKAREARKLNPERFRAIQLASYHRNKHKHLQRSRKAARDWYSKNKERAKLRRADPVVRRALHAKRRALKKGATLGDPRLIEQWMREVRTKRFVRCHWCGTKVSGNDVHFDHVIALGNGGTHSIGNLCCSCPECNLSKHTQTPAEWDKHNQIFLHL